MRNNATHVSYSRRTIFARIIAACGYPGWNPASLNSASCLALIWDPCIFGFRTVMRWWSWSLWIVSAIEISMMTADASCSSTPRTGSGVAKGQLISCSPYLVCSKMEKERYETISAIRLRQLINQDNRSRHASSSCSSFLHCKPVPLNQHGGWVNLQHSYRDMMLHADVSYVKRRKPIKQISYVNQFLWIQIAVDITTVKPSISLLVLRWLCYRDRGGGYPTQVVILEPSKSCTESTSVPPHERRKGKLGDRMSACNNCQPSKVLRCSRWKWWGASHSAESLKLWRPCEGIK